MVAGGFRKGRLRCPRKVPITSFMDRNLWVRGLGLTLVFLAGCASDIQPPGGGPGTTIAVYRRERSGSPVAVAAFIHGDDQGIVERTAFGLA